MTEDFAEPFSRPGHAPHDEDLRGIVGHVCFRRLKHMNDKFTYFIDLDSYLDKFIFNSVKTAELVAGRRALLNHIVT